MTKRESIVVLLISLLALSIAAYVVISYSSPDFKKNVCVKEERLAPWDEKDPFRVMLIIDKHEEFYRVVNAPFYVEPFTLTQQDLVGYKVTTCPEPEEVPDHYEEH